MVVGAVLVVKTDGDIFLYLQNKYALSRWDVYGKCSLCDLMCDSD